MKTYEAIIKISVIVEANNENEAYNEAEIWFHEETHPSYDIELFEIEFVDEED